MRGASPSRSPAEGSVARRTVAVRILDREYEVRCAADEVDELRASANDLDARMRQIRERGKVAGTNRVAIVAALNLAHENMRLRSNEGAASVRIASLAERLARTLDQYAEDD